MSTAGDDMVREFVGDGVVAEHTDQNLQSQNMAGIGGQVVASFGAERHKAVHEEREDRHLVGSGGGTGFFYHKRCCI
jgi:hypothetical protein